ncbi:MAG: hypothetical protein ACI9Y8_000212 [Candidatus Omnitrophota bacterium]|jgi:hypothetical protein
MADNKFGKSDSRNNRLIIVVIVTALALLFVASLMRFGVGEAKWAGLLVSNSSFRLANEFNVPIDEKGVVVSWADNPSYKSGIRQGDLIKSFNGRPIRNIRDFLSATKDLDIEEGVFVDLIRNKKPLFVTIKDHRSFHKKAHNKISQVLREKIVTGGHVAMPVMIPSNRGNGMVTIAMQTPQAPLPTPLEQNAADKILSEGHWLGMELIPLVAQLARMNGVPENTKGVLVDEVSLESAESGFLAGDVVLAVNGIATPDLRLFTEGTRKVKNQRKAQLLISRKGQLLNLTMASKRTLGFSQNEAASPIPPGAISPHRKMDKPCTACHIIMRTGGQLAVDMGDLLPTAPPIMRDAVMPHEDRGKCKNCHVILR